MPRDTASIPKNEATRLLRVEVDLDAAVANWRFFANLPGGAEAAAVVKADAYGLGAARLAPVFAAAGARTFFVATCAEAVHLRVTLGPGPIIYVLGGFRAGEQDAFAGARLQPVLNSIVQANAWVAASRPGAGCALHIDTGLNRLGAPREEAPELAALNLAPELVMSHLACGAERGSSMNVAQRSHFLDVAAAWPGARRSLSSSAGACLGPDFAFDLTRPGIGLYGGAPIDDEPSPVRPVARVSAPILQIRTIGPGESVGYGATFIADRPMQVVTLGAGYADGLLRSLSGRGYAVLGGERRPILGRVSMDLITVDATDLDVAPGDEAEFVGPTLSLEDAAAAAGTASYEVLTSLRDAEKIYRSVL